jgi:hypothetical protein
MSTRSLTQAPTQVLILREPGNRRAQAALITGLNEQRMLTLSQH